VGRALVAALLALGALNLVWALRHRDLLRPVGDGAPAPAFELGLADGGRFRLAPGRPMVLDFWASWCVPCREELPMLDRLAARYRGRADLVAVNVEDAENEPDVRAFLREAHLTMPVALAERYHVEGLPHTVVIDRAGRVAKVFVGETSERAIVEAIDGVM
jgi:cytochrome c biogenesis protein CcmG/thiol:disulfide interchange protein DsbE